MTVIGRLGEFVQAIFETAGLLIATVYVLAALALWGGMAFLVYIAIEPHVIELAGRAVDYDWCATAWIKELCR